jgi:DNA-binding beta-propeller fold protein YncE
MSRPSHPASSRCLRAAGALGFLILLAGFTAEAARSAVCLTTTPLFQLRSGGDKNLRQPSDLTLHEGSLFVLDDLNGRIVEFTQSGRYRRSIPLPGGSRSSYLAVDIGGNDHFFLASSAEGKIVVIDKGGSVVRKFDTGGKDGTSEPVGIDVSRGKCFVADNEEHKIKVFDLEGKPLGEWGGIGDTPRKLRYPFRVVQDSAGRVIVTDSLNSRVKAYTPKGEPLFDFGKFGVVEGTLFRPAGISVWGNDRILVSDNYLGSVQLFDFKGGYHGTLCDSDGTPLLFQNPVSLAAVGGTLFILEAGAGRVQALRVEGR